METPQTFN